MKLNTKLLPLKLHYFLGTAAVAPVIPFIAVIGKQLGLEGGLAIIFTMIPFVGILFKILGSSLADKRNNHKKMLLMSKAVMTIGYTSLYFTPSIREAAVTQQQTNVSFECSEVNSFLRYQHQKQPCGRNDYLSATSNINVTCSLPGMIISAWKNHRISDSNFSYIYAVDVECLDLQASKDSLCEDWNFPHCQSPLQFSAVIDLHASNKEGNESFLPILEITYNHSTKLPYPSCSSMKRLQDCRALCDDVELMKYLDSPEMMPTLAQVMSYFAFWMFFTILILTRCFNTLAYNLSNTLCFMLLDEHGQDYGQQRVYGSLAWGSLCLLTGYLIDVYSGSNPIKDYTPAFILTLTLSTADIINVSRMKVKPKPAVTKTSTPGVCSPCDAAAIKILTQLKVLVFILSCVMVGVSTGALMYQLILVEEVVVAWQCDFKWIKLFDGLVIAIRCFVGELPFFLIAGMLLQRLGNTLCMTVVLLAFGLRFILYSVVTNPWFFLPIEVLHGITYGLSATTMATYANEVALPGTEALIQAIVGTSSRSLGISIGSAIGGYIFFAIGGRQMFFFFGAVNVVFGIAFFIANCLISRFCPTSAMQIDVHELNEKPVGDLENPDASTQMMR